MPTQRTLRRKQKRRLRPGFIVALVVVCVLLAALCAILILQPFSDPSGKSSPAHTATDGSAADDSVLVCKNFDGVDYFPVSGLSAIRTRFSEEGGIIKLSDGSGNEAYFSMEVPEYVIGGRIYLAAGTPVTEGEIVYLDLSTAHALFPALIADPENPAESYPANAAFSLGAPGNSGVLLPEGLNAESCLECLAAQPEYQTVPAQDEVDLPDELKAEYLRLVNVAHPLEKDFVPTDLEIVADARYGGEDAARLRHRAARALNLLLAESRACGYPDVSVTSGYRSYADQSARFQVKVNSLLSEYGTKEEAEKAAATEIQYPGKSEHQSGLACDMHNLLSADTSFGDTPAGIWLAENAYKFGFILRYPADKTEITGISYEPWHFRYVGRYHATRMHYLNLTLEEYTEFLEANANTVLA